MLLVNDVVDVLDFLIIIIDNFSFTFIIFQKGKKMSEKEQIITLKAQNELLKSLLKDKDEEIKSIIVEKTTIKDQLVPNELLKSLLKDKDEELKSAIVEKTTIEEQLESSTSREMKLHTTLKLRATIEKMEDLMRPEEMSREEWQDVPRVKKWTGFFSNPLKYDEYDEFIKCATAINEDPVKLAKLIRKLYGICNARVHNYVNDKEIDVISFHEQNMKLIASCIDKIDIS